MIAELTGLAAIVCTFGLPVVIVGMVFWFKHQKDLAIIKARNESAVGGQQNQALLQRIDTLEKRCAKLEEQVLQAHELLADERRELDRKLAEKFPGMSTGPDSSNEKQPARVPTRS